MNTTNTVQSQSQVSVPGQTTCERAPTPAELIARLKQQKQTPSPATHIRHEGDSDLYRRAWRDIPSFKSLNEGPKDDEVLECAMHAMTLNQDPKQQNDPRTLIKARMQLILAHPAALPVEDHENGGTYEHLVMCIACPDPVGVGTPWGSEKNWDHWCEHLERETHKNNVAKWENINGPLGKVMKSTMPRYKVVYPIVGSSYDTAEVIGPVLGKMLSPHHHLLPKMHLT
ncbi:hypothetical protein DFP72DRAFT_854224 [Ephemerocybe angulata]|uniref:Uncharacterized protein n=1 Tax=Ephemerocybe angulata TaxID=980116 RepID=A0A8H6M0D0_9AGAR|nr:hypothetical protein DFP72DRAFT_854224 [Tulosesus angulatus]